MAGGDRPSKTDDRPPRASAGRSSVACDGPAPRAHLGLALVLLAGLLLAGCGERGSMPDLRIGVTVGPAAHSADVRVSALPGREGSAFVAIVLTYPDGHQERLDSPETGGYGANDTSLAQLDRLPAGAYTCTVYALPYSIADEHYLPNGLKLDKPFPRSAMVKKNVADSVSFVVP